MSRTPPEPDDRHDDLGARIRDAAHDVQAPAHLHAQVAEARAAAHATRPRRRRTWGLAAGLATAVAVALVAVTFLGTDASPAPTVDAAAALALRPADAPAPRAASDDPRYLDAAVGSIRFPSNAYTAAADPSGMREERLSGRRAVAVSYGAGDRRVGYTVVDGPALPWPDGAARTTAGAVEAATYERDGARVVTWRRDGHTCVVASRTVPLPELLRYVGRET